MRAEFRRKKHQAGSVVENPGPRETLECLASYPSAGWAGRRPDPSSHRCRPPAALLRVSSGGGGSRVLVGSMVECKSGTGGGGPPGSGSESGSEPDSEPASASASASISLARLTGAASGQAPAAPWRRATSRASRQTREIVGGAQLVVDVVVNSQVLGVSVMCRLRSREQTSSSTTRCGRQSSQIIQRTSRGNRGKKRNTWSASSGSSASCGRGEAMDDCWDRRGSETDQAERQARNWCRKGRLEGWKAERRDTLHDGDGDGGDALQMGNNKHDINWTQSCFPRPSGVIPTGKATAIKNTKGTVECRIKGWTKRRKECRWCCCPGPPPRRLPQ